MLQKLQVKNYAIIDEATINFREGLNIITGETGAGKSILLGALGLVLGDRADMNALFSADSKCVIEAEFDISQLDLKSFFDTNELDFDNHLILRRELLPSLRSRAFINDTPVKLKVLQTLSEKLINVHRQFATLDIFTREFQTKILDTLAKQIKDFEKYTLLFNAYRKNISEQHIIEDRIQRAARENDFIRFQIEEINEINPDPIQDASIQSTLKQAENADEIKHEINAIENLLIGGETNAQEILTAVQYKASSLVKTNKNFEELANRISSIKIELDDIISALSSFYNDQELAPEELQALTSRYDNLQRIYFKHQLNDSSELLSLLASMESKIQSSNADEERLIEIKAEIKKQEKALTTLANAISKKRHKVVPVLKKRIEAALSELAMSNAKFDVNIAKADAFQSQGIDLVDFTFSANPGSELQGLQQVASGGELSRLSLALKSIIANELALPTMVFDEIDSGVSGDTALRMGKMLRGLGNKHQTIVITHSAQVAAHGDQHYFVSKSSRDSSTKTMINTLDQKDRLEKIAIMLSSDPPTKSARKNAAELLEIGVEN